MTSDNIGEAIVAALDAATVDLDKLVDGTIIAADELNENLDTGLGQLDRDWETAASQLARLRHARQLLSTLENAYERFIGEHAPFGATELLGVGLVTVRRGSDRKQWDHDGLSRAVIDAHVIANEGVSPDPFDVRDWLMDAAAISYWRTTKLKPLGIDVDDYCHKERGRLTVQIDAAEGATDTSSESSASATMV